MKDKTKIILTAIISIVITISVSVAAQFITSANNITYSSVQTDKTNVKDSLDELYTLSEDESISCSQNVALPKITGDLVPVTISKNGTVKKADTSKEWYNYCAKKWANAVILSDKTKTYSNGETIPEDNIESYFVWIPKYKYRLWNVGTTDVNSGPHKIDIIFDTVNTTDVEGVSCTTPLTSGASGNCNNREFMTHPAFITMGVNGFWVGKFETGYKGATNATDAEVTSSNSSKIIIKPNVYSWRNNTVYNMFVSSYNYNRTLNSHMMKNTEWGAVAYLSHSAYGINAEVNINNNSNNLTGKSALPTIDQHTFPGIFGTGDNYNSSYNTKIGYLASTTGNISGVYDMNGGAYEVVAGYISGNVGSSGFTAATIVDYNAKYFDVYNASSYFTAYQYRILGDATGELGPINTYKDSDDGERRHNWYSDFSAFARPSDPWFGRGGPFSEGVLAGLFYFSPYNGGINVKIGYRLVLAP